MRLSEAMLAGQKKRPVQIQFSLRRGVDRACALGCALEGLGIPVTDDSKDYIKLQEIFKLGTLEVKILVLNDTERWTVQQIARWLVESGNDIESKK